MEIVREGTNEQKQRVWTGKRGVKGTWRGTENGWGDTKGERDGERGRGERHGKRVKVTLYLLLTGRVRETGSCNLVWRASERGGA